MLSNAVRFLMVSAAASFVALGAAPADACSLLSSGALDFIAAGTPSGNGAVFLTNVQKEEFWFDPDPIVDAVNDSAKMSSYWGSTSPTSEKYYTEFTKPGAIVSLISNISNVAAGDVLVINKTVAVPGGPQTAYGGHTVIITGPAQQLTTALNPIYTGTIQWALPIADSTSSVHGCDAIWRDSRWTNTCSDFVAGPGTGYMRIYTDSSGVPVGHTWSVTSGGTYFPITSTTVAQRPFVIGRLNSCPLP
ncbi:hypothetical protein [Sorangium sp. So ce363]|uniref:hypothetical protein n=1 Tax=Sorangium sp. So ce363 TaxID=3133304 RepID=UPI003F618258